MTIGSRMLRAISRNRMVKVVDAFAPCFGDAEPPAIPTFRQEGAAGPVNTAALLALRRSLSTDADSGYWRRSGLAARPVDDLFADRTIRNRTMTRVAVQALSDPQTLIGCDLEDADLSRLDLSGWRFEQCNLRRTDF